MSSLPKFSKRAAAQINNFVSRFASDLPDHKYLPVIGWEIGFEADFIAGPALGLHEANLIPEQLQIECHGIRIAYNIPATVMETLESSILDFDGRRFLFVDGNNATC